MNETERDSLQTQPESAHSQASNTVLCIPEPKASPEPFDQGTDKEKDSELLVFITKKNNPSDASRYSVCEKVEMQELISRNSSIEPKWNHYILENIDSFAKRKPTGSLRKALLLYILLAFFSFVFLLTSSCPIPWYRGKFLAVDGVSYQNFCYTIWGVKGSGIANFRNDDLTSSCLVEKQFFRIIAIATITACAFSLISIITASLRLCGYGHYGWTILFASITCLGAFTSAILSLDLFHSTRCDKPVLNSIANLDAGFLLTLYASFCTFMGLVSLVAITGWNIAPALKCVRGMDILFLALLLSSLLLVSVGSVSTVWSREFNGPRVKAVKAAYWHTDVLLQNGSRVYYDQSKYNCPSYQESMQADVTFLFTGSKALFAASLLAVFAVLAPKVRVVSCILAGIASVCLCISWVFSISALQTTFCKDAGEGKRIEDYSGIPFESGGGYTKFDGYLLQEGVVFVIIASVLTLNSVVLNLLFP